MRIIRKKYSMKKRFLSLLLCAVMLCGLIPQGMMIAFAAADDGLCDHHTEHTEDCCYSEGSPCTHEHTEDCYILKMNCTHAHDETCYSAETVPDDNAALLNADDAAGDSTSPSDEDDAAATECTHDCSEESGCITKELACSHTHAEACGYAEAAPCIFVCEICSKQKMDAANVSEYSGPITDDGEYTFTGEVDPIIVESGSPTIILKDVTINGKNTARAADAPGLFRDTITNGKNAPAIWVKAGATLNLQIEGNNTLSGGPGYAGICVEPDYDGDDYSPEGSAKLIVSGDGNLTVTGGEGVEFGSGAGIGGNGQHYDGKMGGVDFGIINFSKQFTGTVNASGGQPSNKLVSFDNKKDYFGAGAGIGSGGLNAYQFNWEIVYGSINIDGGTINACNLKENYIGAGIGSGSTAEYNSMDTILSEININISDGTVTAQGGKLAAGIGGGQNTNSGNINISGGTIVSKSGDNDGSMSAAGLGSGDNASVSSIKITGGTVTAVAAGAGAGIGNGSNPGFSSIQGDETNGDRNKWGIIEISGENTLVNAYGGAVLSKSYNDYFGGAGIGSGYPTGNNARSVALDIIISDGAQVYAYSGKNAQAIGYGYRASKEANDMTGYGIHLDLDDTITLFAFNDGYRKPALVHKTQFECDAQPIKYHSNDTYLIYYKDNQYEGNEDKPASSSEANCYLNIKTDIESQQPDKLSEWSYNDNGEMSINGDYIGETRDMYGNPMKMNGNWAVLYPMPEPDPEYGNLTVSKTVSGGGASTTKDFTFTATLNDTTISGTYGDMTFENGVATFTLKADESKTASNLPAGVDYTVEESDNAGYTVTVNGTSETAATGTIIADQTVTAAFNNYKGGGGTTDPDPEYGNLTVSKTVSGGGASTTKDFTFTVTLNDTTISGTYGDMTFENGIATFTLKADESKTASNLPAGVDYTVEESDNVGYTVTVNGTSETAATGTIIADQTVTAAFNNYKGGGGTTDPDPEYGSVKITKTVQGEKAPVESVAYAFKMWVRNSSGAAVSESVSYAIVKEDRTTETGNATIGADGYTFYLKNGESITFSGITSSRRIEVQEITIGDFTTTTSGLTDGICEISANCTKEIEFVNNYGNITPTPDPDPTPNPDPVDPTTPTNPDRPLDDVPQTGDNSNMGLWLALASLSLFGMAVSLFGRNRRYKRHR